MLQQVMTNPGEIIFRGTLLGGKGKSGFGKDYEYWCFQGSDIHVYHGKHPFTKYPVTQGHESQVRLQNLGKMSQSFMGQKVMIEPQVYWILLSMSSRKV